MSEIRNLTRNGETFYPLTTSSAVINESTGEGLVIDSVPTTGSENLVKSGGVQTKLNTKIDKVPGENLVDPSVLLLSSVIWNDGSIGSAADTFCVSDYIPVIVNGVGQNIVSSAEIVSFAATYNVYDSNKVLLRTIKNAGTNTYTYQSGDAYVRFAFVFAGQSQQPTVEQWAEQVRANYGDTLTTEKYTPYQPLLDLEKRVGASISDINLTLSRELEDKTRNLINRSALTFGALVNASGNIATGYPEGNYAVSDYIPVSEEGIIANSWGDITYWSYGAVYDAFKSLIRTITSQQYIYQPGDAYVRFTFYASDGNIQTSYPARAYYGTILLPYKEYSENSRIDNLEENTNAIVLELNTKLDKVPGENLVDPSVLTLSAYIGSSGDINSGAEDYAVSDYIPVIVNGVGKNISSNALKTSYAGTYVVYDENRNYLRRVLGTDVSNKYEYQEGDAYVRFGFMGPGLHPTLKERAELYKANYGDTLTTEKYTTYQPLLELEERVEALEEGGGSEEISISTPNAIYSVYNSIQTSRQTISRLYLSHLLDSAEYKNQGLYFENIIRNLPIVPSVVTTKSETTKTINIVSKGSKYKNKSFTTKMRIADAAASKNVTPKILIIGDSVTDAYGADSNRKTNWLPIQYGAFAKMFFEMDKIDGGDNANEYNAIFLGGAFNRSYDFNINYNGVTRAVRSKSQGQGGAQLNELYDATWGGGSENPFYDTVNETFSIADYIAKYRTMDDLGIRLTSSSSDPHGETVTGSDGNSYIIGTKITSQSLLSSIDVCTPTHIVINLNHNTSEANFQTYFPLVISKIQSELPNVVIICMAIDETGTYFPCDYPNYDSSMLNYLGLHSSNLAKCIWFKNNALDEANNVYLLDSTYFCQPTAESQPSIEIDCAEYVNRDNTDKTTIFHIENKKISGSHWHPNNLCHEAWGYQLYAMIKYIIS